jgi:hypothetical protein
MLFVQVVHKAGSSSQVLVSDAHQGEAEVQAGDGPATEPQEEGEGHGEEEEGHGHTHFEGAIDEREVNEELLRRFEMEANGDERGLEEDSSDDEDDSLVPRDWDTYNFSQLSVNAGENVAWEYRENAVSIGAMYKSVLWDSRSYRTQTMKSNKAQEPKPKHKPKDNQKHFFNSIFLKRRSPLQVPIRLLL